MSIRIESHGEFMPCNKELQSILFLGSLIQLVSVERIFRKAVSFISALGTK